MRNRCLTPILFLKWMVYMIQRDEGQPSRSTPGIRNHCSLVLDFRVSQHLQSQKAASNPRMVQAMVRTQFQRTNAWINGS